MRADELHLLQTRVEPSIARWVAEQAARERRSVSAWLRTQLEALHAERTRA